MNPSVGLITIQDRKFVLGNIVSCQYALIGWGTCIIEADGGTVVIKLSWPEKNRMPEYEFLEQAYMSAKEYSDGKYEHMKNHLPVLKVKEDFSEWGLQTHIHTQLDPLGMGLHILRVTVYQKLVPMTKIQTADDLMSMM
jgi:hypothetical protein